MPPIATELNDKTNGHWPQLTISKDGARGVRFYRVNTMSEVVALSATGIPAIGTLWSEPFTLSGIIVNVTSIDPEYIGGRDATDTGGHTIVRVDYESPGISIDGTDDGYEDGDAWTTISGSIRSVQVQYDVAGVRIPETQREASVQEVIVTAYMNRDRVIAAVALWLSLQNTVNNNTVVLPGLWHNATPWIIAPGGGAGTPAHLLARTFSVRELVRDEGLFAVEYKMGFGPVDAFKFSWRQQDENGDPVGPVVESDVQPSVAWPNGFGTLW